MWTAPTSQPTCTDLISHPDSYNSTQNRILGMAWLFLDPPFSLNVYQLAVSRRSSGLPYSYINPSARSPFPGDAVLMFGLWRRAASSSRLAPALAWIWTIHRMEKGHQNIQILWNSGFDVKIVTLVSLMVICLHTCIHFKRLHDTKDLLCMTKLNIRTLL